ncbi:DUF819 domain-containing protein [Mammaliicoccus vitulinus]|uniref:DUF819 family protein n=1 Tax=Mammaliicoccus vitulinus TaxID=71237 RepID=UPI000D1D2080|nr:DUF819 family protein [Mammaliicoccus vitulinus]MBO3077069.1 DUF819 domain-containing protein [Mammaliicoccus vitulinus]PTI88215.1 hypothetical protein BU071_09920 [Mammaliicoccus vitulinus]QQT16204.1 DUF819 domain-containing protein [Mammaliicoccus vitulinus]QQY18501.1 DUF819 domain-containing protein [Mammaliicoccus vitulinus]RIN14650.1 DUF819 domain-containing protein [Mammaliicoccus vitulinus]
MYLNAFINKDETWLLWAILVSIAALSIYLEQRYAFASKITGAIIALIGAMILSNLNIIPIESPVYDQVWNYVIPLAIPLLLFRSNIFKIWKESRRLLFIFLISSIGTVVGVAVAFLLLHQFIPELDKIGAMMTGSYIGGGVNFAALSTKFQTPGELVSATVVADNSVMAFYFIVLITLPNLKFIKKHFKRLHTENNQSEGNNAEAYWKRNEISLKDIAYSFAIAFSLVAISFKISETVNSVVPKSNPFMEILVSIIGDQFLLLTTLTLIIVAIFSRFFEKLNASDELGTFLIYIFFVVIGVPASIPIIIKTAPLLFIFVAIILIFNLGITLSFGKLFKFNIEEMLLASNANAGGPTTAAALAISKGWHSLVGPILIIGTLGYVIGNYVGTMMGYYLSQFM